MEIGPGDLDDPVVVAFLEEHVVQLRSMGPPESTHVLDLPGLRAPGVRFYTARDESTDELLGCAAFQPLAGDATHAELKSMRTAPRRTRQGIAAALLDHLLDQARAAGFVRISLETGSYAYFHPAHALYLRHGFIECAPFGDYRPDPLSTFLTLRLTRAGG